MAERRMLKKSILSTDRFLDMSAGAQLLYVHFNLNADDDGFVGNPRTLCRIVGVSSEEQRELESNGYIISFECGAAVITHWRMSNAIRKDTYNETEFKKEKAMLELDENDVYYLSCNEGSTLGKRNVNVTSTVRKRHVNGPSTQDSIGKDSTDKESTDKGSLVEDSTVKDSIVEDSAGECRVEEGYKGGDPLTAKIAILPCARAEHGDKRHKYGNYKNVMLSDEELEMVRSEFPDDWSERIERLSEYIASTGKRYKSHLATIRSWSKNGKDNRGASRTQSSYDLFMEELKRISEEE